VALLQALTVVRSEAIESRPAARGTDDPAAKTPSIGPEQRAQLKATAKTLECSVLMVAGIPRVGTGADLTPAGTAFVISRKDRLLATAAHVAHHVVDSEYVIASTADASVRLRVDRVFYHPRIRRRLDEGLCAFSMDPADGPPAHPTIDVAVLRVVDDGVELPAACVLATEDELRDLSNRPFGMLGFPESDGDDWHWPTKSWPVATHSLISDLGQPVSYTRERTEDRVQDQSAPETQRRWVRSSESLGHGASGGPLFLPNGHVFAVNSGTSFESASNESRFYSEPIRIDAVREILAHHQLGDRVAFDDARETKATGAAADDRLPQLRKAVALARRSDELLTRGQIREAGALCNEAILGVPDYGWAFLRRARIYLTYCQSQWASLSIGERQRFATMARADVERCDSLIHPWREEITILLVYSDLYANYAEPDEASLKRSIDGLDSLIPWHESNDMEGTEYRSALLNARAQFRELSKEYQMAQDDYSRAIQMNPKEPRWLIDRAHFWERRGRRDLALNDLVAVDRLKRQKSGSSK
jgi:Trypsin-like peptidase domain